MLDDFKFTIKGVTLSKEKGLSSTQFEMQSYWKCCFSISAPVLGNAV